MISRILWCILPVLARIPNREHRDVITSPLNHVTVTRAWRRLNEDIVLTEQEIAEYKAEMKRSKNWDEVKKRYENNDHEMFKRIKFRNEHVVIPTLKRIRDEFGLHITVPEAHEIPGSRTTTSDFDVTIGVQKMNPRNEYNEVAFLDSLLHLGDDVEAAKHFVRIISEEYGGSPGVEFDSNVYVAGLASSPFRPTAQDLQQIQDVAALTKLKRYAPTEMWERIKSDVGSLSEDAARTDPGNSGKMLSNFLEAELETLNNEKSLAEKLGFNVQRRADGTFDVGAIDAFLRNADPNLVAAAEYDLYVERMSEARSVEADLERLKRKPPAGESARREWQAQKQGMLNHLKKLISLSMYFAPEAYSSEGAFVHIVKYEQMRDGNDAPNSHARHRGSVGEMIDRYEALESTSRKKNQFAALSAFDFFCSMNEQAGDFFKDVFIHYAHDPDYALVAASKYLKRFYDAIDLMNQKVQDAPQSILAQKWKPMDVQAKRQAIGPLLAIRKSATSAIAKTAQAELHVRNNPVFTGTLGTDVRTIAENVASDLVRVNNMFRSLHDLSSPAASKVHDGTPKSPPDSGFGDDWDIEDDDTSTHPEDDDTWRHREDDGTRRHREHDDTRRHREHDDTRRHREHDDTRRHREHDDTRRHREHDDTRRHRKHDGTSRHREHDSDELNKIYAGHEVKCYMLGRR